MGVNCPHCSGDVQETVDSVLKDRVARANKKTENAKKELELTNAKLREMQSNAKPKELEELREKVAKYETQIQTNERTDFLAGLLGGDKEGAAKVLDDLNLLYENRAKPGEDGEMPSFSDFYADGGAGRSLTLVQMMLPEGAGVATEPPATGAAPGSSSSVPAVVRAPNTSTGAAPTAPRSSAKMTPQQLAAHFNSPAHKSLPRAEQVAREQQLAKQHGAGYGYSIPGQ